MKKLTCLLLAALILYTSGGFSALAREKGIWNINSESSGNSRVDSTDTDGTFNVFTEQSKTPVAVSEDGKKIYVADEWNGYQKTVAIDSSLKNYSKYISYRKGLANTYNKLKNGEELNVVYFGGSVTDGYGASDKEQSSWRAKISDWLVKNYPDSKINNIYKALGESGTYMGCFRIDRILEEVAPDLIFIEYSINDYYNNASYARASSQFETIVRTIKAKYPNCDIATILVTEQSLVNNAGAGILHTQAQAHEDISKIYNIPSLKFGSALANNINLSNWNSYFKDIVHPLDAGHNEYYKCIEEFMTNALKYADYDNAAAKEVKIPVQSDYLFDGERTVIDITPELLSKSEGSGFVYQNGTYYEFNGNIFAANAGSTFTYTFTGTETAIFGNVTSDKAPTVKVDGVSYTPAAGALSHNPIKLVEGLSSGEHTVEITSTVAGMTIYAIFSHDTTKRTPKGTGADTEYKYNTLVLPEGSYNVKYFNKDSKVGDITKPQLEGKIFLNWRDAQGNIIEDNEKLTSGMKLSAKYLVSGKNVFADVNSDDFTDSADLTLLKHILLGKSDADYYDVNADGSCDVRDLVALKKYLADASDYGDNDFSIYDLE